MNHDAPGKIGIDVGHDAASSTDGSLRNPGGDRPVAERRTTGFRRHCLTSGETVGSRLRMLRFDGKVISVAAHYNQSAACARASTRSSSRGGIMSPQHLSGNGRDLLTQLGV